MIVSQERPIHQNRYPVSVEAAILSRDGIECRIPFVSIPLCSPVQNRIVFELDRVGTVD